MLKETLYRLFRLLLTQERPKKGIVGKTKGKTRGEKEETRETRGKTKQKEK